MLIVKGKKRVRGRGLIDTVINKLPFGLELPTYEYCGPGTKIEDKLAKNIPGKNPLDEACKLHDIAYWKNKDLATRHAADRELVERAWERFKSSDASVGEKAASWLVTSLLKGKLAMGAGGKKRKTGKIAPKKTVTACGSGVNKGVKTRKLGGVRVIPLPKGGALLDYIIPLLTGLSQIGSFAGSANDLLKALQSMKGKGLDEKGKIGMYRNGYGLYLRPPYDPNL